MCNGREPTCDVFLFYKIQLRAPISNAETHTQKLLGVKTGRVPGSSSGYTSKKPEFSDTYNFVFRIDTGTT